MIAIRIHVLLGGEEYGLRLSPRAGRTTCYLQLLTPLAIGTAYILDRLVRTELRQLYNLVGQLRRRKCESYGKLVRSSECELNIDVLSYNATYGLLV